MTTAQQAPPMRFSRSSASNAIHSMTGYGRATRRTSHGSISVELRSTNHRYLEIDQRLPTGLGGLQERVAGLIRDHVH